MYEERWRVQILDNSLEIVYPTNASQRIRLEDIRGISIETNDSGPIDADVIWHVFDGATTLSFPMGATGESDVMQVFQTLDGFNNQELINAMASTGNNMFILLNRIKA